MDCRIEWGLHFSGITKPTVEIGWLKDPKPPPSDVDSCPARFRCAACFEYYPKSRYGGRVDDERVCKFCYPNVTHLPPEPYHPTAERSADLPVVFDVWSKLPEEIMDNE